MGLYICWFWFVSVYQHDSSVSIVHSLKTKDRHFGNFFVTGGAVSCHYNNLQCHLWWQICLINDLFCCFLWFQSTICVFVSLQYHLHWSIWFENIRASVHIKWSSWFSSNRDLSCGHRNGELLTHILNKTRLCNFYDFTFLILGILFCCKQDMSW